VRVGPNGQHLVAGNRTFLPLGFNIAWPTDNRSVAVLDFYGGYFAEMAAAGANFARVWLGPCLNASASFNRLQLLTTDGTPGSAPRVDLARAAVLDQLLDLAESHGIRLLLALDSFNSLCPGAVNAYCDYEASVWAPLLESGRGKPGVSFLRFWSANATVAAWASYQAYVANRYSLLTSALSLTFHLLTHSPSTCCKQGTWQTATARTRRCSRCSSSTRWTPRTSMCSAPRTPGTQTWRRGCTRCGRRCS